MIHLCISKIIIIGSDNGFSPGRRQAIIWINAGILLIGPLGTNFIENVIEIYTFSFEKMHVKMSSGQRRPSCPGLNVLSKSYWNHICPSVPVSFLQNLMIFSKKQNKVYPMEHMHGFIFSYFDVLLIISSNWIHMTHLSILFRVASLKPRSHLADRTADLSRPWWSGEVLGSRREVGKERG